MTIEKPKLSRPRWIVLATVVLSMLGVGLAGVVYIGHVDSQREAAERESDRRWCDLLVTMDDAYRSGPPPTTDVGKRVAAAIHTLRVQLGC